ncbi:hypothetical protein BJV82DRAFT_370025 [Fennellomyces sp. T-0311]|nr:hypothetical protein BJV82DRAFT_370025 [Fennellomyces sp. T-0311]
MPYASKSTTDEATFVSVKCTKLKAIQQRPSNITKKHRLAKEHVNIRIDWVTLLPTEITANIFEYISTGDRMNCTTVSKVWRTKIMGTRQIWQLTESTLFSGAGFRSGTLRKMLPFVGQHIETFVMHVFPNDFFPLMVQGHFPNMRAMQILAITLPGVQQVNRDLYLSALKKVGKTLTVLDTTINTKQDPPTFTETMAACPNLVKLRYRTEATWHPCQEPSNATGEYKLTELEIDTSSDEGIPLGDLEVILKQCPKLKKLRVLNCHYAHVLDIVNRCCPKIEELSYHMSESEGMSDAAKDHFPITFSPELPKTPGQLRRIHLMKDVAEEPMPWPGVARILKRASPTLQDLFCSFNHEDHEFRQIFGGNPQQFYMPCLYSFKCTIGDKLSQKYVASIIRNAPNLGAVHILNCWDFLDDDILDALATLSNLKYLELHENKRAKESSLLRLFDKHVQLGSTSHLEYVALAGDFVTDKVLMTLAQIPTLRGLELEYCNAVSQAALGHFIKKMKNRVTFLATIPNLRHVRLQNCPKLNHSGLQELVETSTSLTHLELNEAIRTTYEFGDYAAEKLAYFDPQFLVVESTFIMSSPFFQVLRKYDNEF